MKRKRMVDPVFDAEHDVDTGGLTPLRYLQGVPADSDGVDHIAIDPTEFADAMAALDIDSRRYTFVDLGAGKGRALILAAELPFQRLIGVEFAEELATIAEANFARLRASHPAMSEVEIIRQDAGEFRLPITPTVLFLYNPFGARTMTKVARNAHASLAQNPRELLVLYVNPMHLAPWRAAGFAETHRGKHFVLLRSD